MSTPEEIILPREIARANEHDVKIIWPDGEVILPAFELRADCWCAMCVDEASGRKLLKRESLRADVHPKMIKPIGNYAIQIEFSDGHRTGLYTFKHLRELGDRLAKSG
ncbi:MAG: DUF971 domain-containing protein [Nitrospirae bacterium]|nr:DUF971 domain-containing protein [Nitrospirota bacterium]